jgi:phospholipid-binding lipoprotein MlaA
MRQRAAMAAAIAFAALELVACAGTPPNPADPWQGMNRPVFEFNEDVDRVAIGPAARGWTAITSDGIRDALAKFFYNAAFPVRFVSNVGQGEAQQALIEVARFGVNTTAGLLGFFDPATRWGIARRDEDMGQMFGRWGIPSGNYLVLPVLGPSNPRDATGLLFDAALSPFTWISFLVVPLWGGPTVVDLLNTRARADERIENARRSALDYYVFVRDAYQQYRAAAIANTNAASDYNAGEIYGTGPSDDLYDADGTEEAPDAR